MTKAATMDVRKALTMLLLTAMLATMIPITVVIVLTGGVLAGDNSTASSHITATFTAGNVAPTVNSITLTDNSDVTQTTMNPQAEYKIRVDVTDNNTLADLASVQVYLYYDADGVYANPGDPAADNQTCAVLLWTPSTFSLGTGHSGSSWSLHGVTPTLSANNGVFQFHVTPGKVARESADGGDAAQWHIHADAHDASTVGDNYVTGCEINWYGEIGSVTSSINWGAQSVGCDNVTSSAISATYYANGNFSEQVCSTTSWTSGGNTLTLNTSGNPGSGQFSLRADDTNNVANGVQVTGSYQDIDATGTITLEAGHATTTNYVWLTLGHTGIPVGTYSGEVYFKVTNR